MECNECKDIRRVNREYAHVYVYTYIHTEMMEVLPFRLDV